MKIYPVFKKHKIAIVIMITMITIIGILYFVAIPALINIESHRAVIEKAIKENEPVPVKLGKLDTSMTLNLGVVVHSEFADVRHVDNTDYIKTGPVSVEISLPSLLIKRS